ncbi:MAG: electron transfer flavoprotein subunit alpha/FixB family protein [Burkholderiaceae bacterium]|nr:electron transfer flavoprotein subunit alpha/FixB family protein [Burkholderiaceae bacterium]
MSVAPNRLTVILPFAPDEWRAHDDLLAAAAALYSEGSFEALDIVQFSPAAGIVPARAARSATWWECSSGSVSADSDVETLATHVREALAIEGLRDARQRLVLLPPGSGGEELAALIAADFDGVSLGRCSRLEVDGAAVAARRAAFGGRVSIELRTQVAFCCATLRPYLPSIAMIQLLPDEAICRVSLSSEAAPRRDFELVESADSLPRLEGAAVVVSGGRGMDGTEGFELLARIASSLGAALGGSLPTVDAGWVPVARQIGQSGKFVASRLYFAVGISGTPQHLAGVSPATRIVALNKDPEAAIFDVAEVGVVGDWREILPLLAQRLESGPSAD